MGNQAAYGFYEMVKIRFYVQTLVGSKPLHKGGDKCGCMRSAFSLCITVKATTAMRKGA